MTLDQTLMEIEPIFKSTDNTFQFSQYPFQEALTAKQYAQEINAGDLPVRDAYWLSWKTNTPDKVRKFLIGFLKPKKTSEIVDLLVQDDKLLEKTLNGIEFSSQGKNGLVVLIRSTVGSFIAEKSISTIVRYLHNHYGIMLVTIEGCKGELDTRPFAIYSDDQIKETVALYFAKEGKLDGAAIAHMMERGGFHFYGVEDSERHLKSAQLYLTYFNNQSVIEQYISHIRYFADLNPNLIEIYTKIIRMQAVPEDLEFYKINNLQFELSYLERHCTGHIRELYPFFQNGLEFYRLTNERSILMVDNLDTTMKFKRQSAAIMVTTGFHTPKQIPAIKGRGYSLVVISPRIEELEEDRLENFGKTLRGDKTEFDKFYDEVMKTVGKVDHLFKNRGS